MDPLNRLQETLATSGSDAMLITDMSSVGWLTGFSGTYGRAIVTPKDALFITDSRYTLQAQEEVLNMPTVWFGSPTDADEFLAEQLKKLGVSKVGFEGTTTYTQWQKWNQKLGVELSEAPDVVGDLRMQKSEAEIDKVRRACAVSDAAFAHIIKFIQPGQTELEVATELEMFMRKQGSEAAFPIIVVSGERSARPHGKPSSKKLENGDFVTMDFGARVEGYNSDMTRTIVVGEATERHKRVYECLLEAQVEAVHAMRPGVLARDVDKLSREILATNDLSQYFGHGLGHGLGRLVHDSGRLSPTSDNVLKPGQIWTVEPGVYIPGFGGVRIEDDVLITETGVEILTHSTKELLELPQR
jgi:Xaa-Pro aminopeptidase